MRLTVEQDVIFPNVPEAKLEAMQQVCQPKCGDQYIRLRMHHTLELNMVTLPALRWLLLGK